jgi:hypothetical protein
MRGRMLTLCLGAILLASSHMTTAARADDGTAPTGQLTVPWDEFSKLLNLEEDQIVVSLDTFQKLVAHVTPTTTPRYTIQGGNVILSREAFRQLVDAMKPPMEPGAKPPFDYLMTKAIYSGRMQSRNTVFTGTFHVHVLSKDVYLKIPILPQVIALEDVTVDDQQALVVRESGYHQVILSTSGEHVVTASFSLRSSLEQGPHKIDLAVQETPITLLRLDLPMTGIEVEIPQAQQLITSPSEDRTVVSAILAPGRAISVRWRDKVAVAEKVPPKLYSEVHQVISIEDDVLKISSDINYNILHSEVDKIRLSVPGDMNVLSILGEGIGEWQEISEGADRRILVPFTYGRKGAVTVRVVAEKPLSDGTSTTAVSGLQILDTVRETGFIGIEVKTSAEVTITESEGLEPIGVQKLPQVLHQRAVKPLMHGFKYLKHPYNLVLSIRKHEKLAVPIATIASANAVTLVTEDGKVVHRIVYQARNSAKQFLEIQLPEKADVWTVFVDNQPVESAINGQGKLLVPLIRSRVVNNNLSSFPIEVIYCLVEDRFSAVGDRLAMLPPIDLLTSQLIWSVYLPNDYTYIRFSSTLEKEKMIRALNVFAGAQRQYNESAMKKAYDFRSNRAGELSSADELRDAYEGADYESEFRNLPLGEEQLSSQVTAELEFGQRLEGLKQQAPQAAGSGGSAGTGVLPIQIQVPTGGQVYRFAKTIIRSEDPLMMSVTYGTNWLMSGIKWVILAVVIGLIYLNRRSLSRALRWVEGRVSSFWGFCRKHEGTAKGISQSIMTPVVLLGLLVPSWFASPRLTALILFLLWLSVIYQIVFRSQRRARAKAVAQGQATEGRADS